MVILLMLPDLPHFFLVIRPCSHTPAINLLSTMLLLLIETCTVSLVDTISQLISQSKDLMAES